MFADLWPDVPADEVPITLGHQRRARRHLGVARDGRPARRATCCPSGTRPSAERWDAHRRRRATTRCGGRASRAASGSSRSSASGCASQLLGARAVGVRRRVDRRGARPARRSRSASPAASPPTSGPRCCCRSPSGCSALLLSGDRPVQFVFAGKAHPADDDRQGDDPPDRRVRRRPRRPPPLRVPRGLRHRRRPRAATRAPTCG